MLIYQSSLAIIFVVNYATEIFSSQLRATEITGYLIGIILFSHVNIVNIKAGLTSNEIVRSMSAGDILI